MDCGSKCIADLGALGMVQRPKWGVPMVVNVATSSDDGYLAMSAPATAPKAPEVMIVVAEGNPILGGFFRVLI